MVAQTGEGEENATNEATSSGTTLGVGANEPRGAKASEKGGKIDDIPANRQSMSHLPPMLAVRGISDSTQVKKILRSMITAQVPVMYQTMMMVENGAATGFMGSMKTVSKLLNNVTNSAKLELRMKQIADPTGAEALGYANAIHEGMKKQSEQQGKNLWPVGIFYASGDKLDEQPLQSGAGFTIEQDLRRHPKGGSTAADALQQQGGVSAQAAVNLNSGVQVMQANSGPSSNEVKLSEILWGALGSGTPRSTSFADDKSFQTLLVGDLVIDNSDARAGQPYSQAKVSFRDAEHTVRDKNPAQGRAGDDGNLRGFHYLKHKTKEALWRNAYQLMDEYCVFKAENENRGRPIFQKLTSASKFTPEMLKNSSSPSFKWTVSLLDIFFKTWVETRSVDPNVPTKIVCDFNNPDPAATMPIDFRAPTNQFDDCTANPKYCARNKWILRLVDIMAEDRVVADFKNWHESAINRALGHHPWVAIKVEELLCTSLRAGRSVDSYQAKDLVLCDSATWLEGLAEQNRQRWVNVVGELSKMAQNAVGSSSFRPQQNNVQNSPGGSVNSGT